MKRQRLAVIGTPFWSNYQIPTRKELECVEIYNTISSKNISIPSRN
jgi:hypothetical protein